MQQTSNEPILTISELSVNFFDGMNHFEALRNISFHLHKGEVVALVGESGSGKSVTILSILRLLPEAAVNYTSGKICFHAASGEEDILKMPRKQLEQLRGKKVGMIFQEPMTALNPVMRCGKQITEMLIRHYSYSVKEARLQAIQWLHKVKIKEAESIFDRYPHQLSGGQKQRVMIAMAMCCRPQILLCDEPTTALDVTVQKEILVLIRELQKETGTGVIFVTHDLGVVAEIADRVMVLWKGEIVENKPVKELFSSARHPYTKGLLACRPALYSKGQRLPIVKDFLKEGYTSPVNVMPPLLSARGTLLTVAELSVYYTLKKSFSGKKRSVKKALDNISFAIQQGETLGIVGESGSGKSTLGKALLGLVLPDSGTICYGDKKNGLLPFSKQSMQLIFQDPYASLNPRMTIGEAIAEPLVVHKILREKQAIRNRVIALLDKVGIAPEAIDRYPHEFSGGQRQRIVIARALALSPQFIVCDEAVAALDVSVQAQVLNLLNDLKREYGFTIVFISHDLSVVRYISDRILVMQEGRIVEQGDAEMVYSYPQHPYTRSLIAAIPSVEIA